VKTVSLLELLRLGTLGGVGPGATEAEVRAALGEPEHVGELTWRTHGRPKLLLWGRIEVCLDEESWTTRYVQLDLACQSPALTELGCAELHVDSHGIHAEMPMDAFVALLEREQIPYEIAQAVGDHVRLVRTPAGAEAFFQVEFDEYAPPLGLCAVFSSPISMRRRAGS
jgi:hypothetical protein